MRKPPALKVRNAQHSIAIDATGLARFGTIACTLAAQRKRPGCDLLSIDEITVAVVSDACITKLHQRFCGEPTATDVLTFRHGEIVVSADTARSQAQAFRTSVAHELRLYILHGLLHLCGFNDIGSRARRVMMQAQKELLRAALTIERAGVRVSFENGRALGRRATRRSNSRAVARRA